MFMEFGMYIWLYFKMMLVYDRNRSAKQYYDLNMYIYISIWYIYIYICIYCLISMKSAISWTTFYDSHSRWRLREKAIRKNV